METVFDKILQNSQKWFLCAHTESIIFLCFELQQIRDHIYYTFTLYLPSIFIVNVVSDLLYLNA